jgi:hypothetical protein
MVDAQGGIASMLRRNLPLWAAAVLVLVSLVPMSGRAQEPNASGLSGPTQSASDSSLTLADLQNRRQQIVFVDEVFQ